MRVAVLGGGMSGLFSAHYLLKSGHQPVVFEGSSRLGGLAASFDHEGIAIDQFHHTIHEADSAFCGLLGDLGVIGRVIWRRTESALILDGEVLSERMVDRVLRRVNLDWSQRLRIALANLYLTRVKRYALDLDGVTATDWIRGLFGQQAYHTFLEPALRGRFETYAEEVSAFWLWSLLARERNGKLGVRGYVRGGYAWLADQLRQAIEERGGEIRVDAEPEGIESEGARVVVEAEGSAESFDAAISTLPTPLLAKIARGPLAREVPLPDLRYQGLIDVAVVSRARLSPYYWTSSVDPSFPFRGIAESTHLVPPEWMRGRHVQHLLQYCGAHSEAFLLPDDVVEKTALESLQRFFPGFDRSQVERVHVARTAYAEPVFTVGYLARRPQPRIGETRVYLCTAAQAYPRATSWNTSVALAREAVTALGREVN